MKGRYHDGDMAYFGQQSTRREKEAAEAERGMIDLKRALFMRDHLREKFLGKVRRVSKFGLFIELEPHYVEGLLHVTEMTDDYYVYDEKRLRLVGRRKNKKIFKVGDKIWVIVRDVSLENRTISLSLV
jgi:ribonuclease R